MSWKYFTSEELAQLLGISEEDFHRKVKRLIKRDFKEELDQMNVKNQIFC
jgi:predicted HTH transcriptional regulator